MAFVDELKAVFIVVGRTVKDFFGGDSNPLSRYMKEIGIALMIVLLAAGGYLGYRAYIVSREQRAHQSFSDYVQEYQTALKTDSKQEWERMATLSANGYEQNRASQIAPLFLSLQSEAQLKLGKSVEAINTLGKAIELLPAGSPLAPALQLRQSLLQLDADDDALSKVGLQQLISIARDKEGSFKDMALFYLGRYYWAQDQIEEAKKTWQELEDSSWYDKAYPSPWMQEVKQKLKLLPA